MKKSVKKSGKKSVAAIAKDLKKPVTIDVIAQVIKKPKADVKKAIAAATNGGAKSKKIADIVKKIEKPQTIAVIADVIQKPEAAIKKAFGTPDGSHLTGAKVKRAIASATARKAAIQKASKKRPLVFKSNQKPVKFLKSMLAKMEKNLPKLRAVIAKRGG